MISANFIEIYGWKIVRDQIESLKWSALMWARSKIIRLFDEFDMICDLIWYETWSLFECEAGIDFYDTFMWSKGNIEGIINNDNKYTTKQKLWLNLVREPSVTS